MIDLTKPLQLADGTPVRSARIARGGLRIHAAVGDQNTRVFTLQGKHVFNELPDLQNVPEEAKKFYCGSLEGEVIAENRHQYVVKGGLYGSFFLLDRRTLRDQDGDLWSPEPPAPVVRWFNVYDDGSFGTTAHASFEDALDHSRCDKTRIGVMEKVYERGIVTSSKLHSTTPQRRSSANPEGVNPYA